MKILCYRIIAAEQLPITSKASGGQVVPPSWKEASRAVPSEYLPPVTTGVNFPEIGKRAKVLGHGDIQWHTPCRIPVFLGMEGGITEEDLLVLKRSNWEITPND